MTAMSNGWLSLQSALQGKNSYNYLSRSFKWEIKYGGLTIPVIINYKVQINISHILGYIPKIQFYATCIF